MPKRKRGPESELEEKLEKCSQEVFRALKSAKGLERQRLSKRQRDDTATAEKKQRLEREIAVLKSLDLHQTACAHFYSALARVKSLTESDALPEHVRNGIPRPELEDAEKAALHNVTSNLYNQQSVKKAVNDGVEAICRLLDVPLPMKTKKPKKNDRKELGEQVQGKPEAAVPEETLRPDEDMEETDFEGFETDVDEPGSTVQDLDSEGEAEEEAEMAAYDGLLGSSSEEDGSGDEMDEDLYEKYRGKEQVDLDDISMSSGSETDVEDEVDTAGASPSPPPSPARKAKTQSSKTSSKSKTASGPTRSSTFLPSLMGGYISGSESDASSIDVAPAKKRRGQRQRQAIWEKKYGGTAKHLQQPQKSAWDARRGAVDANDRKPWKKGVTNPFAASGPAAGDATGGGSAHRPTAKQFKRDDQGPLHPSWEARKKAKEETKAVAFSGSKIVFD